MIIQSRPAVSKTTHRASPAKITAGDGSHPPLTKPAAEPGVGECLPLGPGMVVLGDRGFPSHEGLLAIRGTGAHFVMRASASWGLKRCGKPLADGTYLTKTSFRGRTMKARVIEFHIDFNAPRGALPYRPRSGQEMEEVFLGLMAYPDP